METENTIIDEERICKDCGRKMPADWLFCPCQFGGPRNIMLDENIAEMERLLEESIKCLHEKPSSHIYDAVIGASVHLLKQIKKYQNKLTGISDQELVLGTDNCCFLVSGEDLGQQDSKFISFLRDEGFKGKYGFWDCPWIWVNIETKVYGRGRPGVKYCNAIGDHAITIDEFMTMYNIYKKYLGLPALQFPQ
nr:hypothetical protein [Clostridia bacterium]